MVVVDVYNMRRPNTLLIRNEHFLSLFIDCFPFLTDQVIRLVGRNRMSFPMSLNLYLGKGNTARVYSQ